MGADGYLRIEGRLDDVINVAGHRLSTKQMEQLIAAAKETKKARTHRPQRPIGQGLMMLMLMTVDVTSKDPHWGGVAK